jgi:uncharacterized protein YjcR
MTSNEPLPDRCGAECRDGGYCENYPKGDNDRCRMHGADGGAEEGNDNAKTHGAFSDHFRSDLTEPEERALEAMVEHLEAIDDERTIAAEIAAEALLKYKRSADSRFLREARQWVSDFNLLPNEDVTELRGEDGGPIGVESEVVTVMADDPDDDA